MPQASIRFYAELNDFLPPEDRYKPVVRHFDVSGSLKDLVESLGVPHTEVDLVLVNGEAADFRYQVRDGDSISFYPVFESFDIAGVSRVRAEPLRDLRFVLDVHLGRLARYLRMAGFDALYRNDAADAELATTVARERRVVLTRDRYLLMRNEVDRGYWVRSTEPRRQLAEVLRRFDLIRAMRPFTRCMECNTPLESTTREAVSDRLPPQLPAEADVRRCPGCGRVYWPGGHHARMRRLLEWVGVNTA
jgi:uncharacterized protein with PIN domain